MYIGIITGNRKEVGRGGGGTNRVFKVCHRDSCGVVFLALRSLVLAPHSPVSACHFLALACLPAEILPPLSLHVLVLQI